MTPPQSIFRGALLRLHLTHGRAGRCGQDLSHRMAPGHVVCHVSIHWGGLGVNVGIHMAYMESQALQSWNPNPGFAEGDVFWFYSCG